MNEFDEAVSLLAIPHRRQPAFWHLVLSGPAALPAARRGLKADDEAVRSECTRVLDHLVDSESWAELLAMTDVLPRSIDLLQNDPYQFVRAIACEVVGRWAHTDEDALAALVAAHKSDPHPSVRKKAGWFCPGGTIYEKTKPRAARAISMMSSTR